MIYKAAFRETYAQAPRVGRAYSGKPLAPHFEFLRCSTSIRLP